MISIPSDDPRTTSLQCHSLQPVTIIHENKWFSLVNRGGFYTLEYHWPQVVVLPVVERNSIAMVKVKRPVIADSPLELPAGGARKHETPREAAARELAEETGIRIADLKRFKNLPPIANSPNRNPNLTCIFEVYVEKREFETRARHDEEIVEVNLFDFNKIRDMLIEGEIYVAVPAAVISRHLLEYGYLSHVFAE